MYIYEKNISYLPMCIPQKYMIPCMYEKTLQKYFLKKKVEQCCAALCNLSCENDTLRCVRIFLRKYCCVCVSRHLCLSRHVCVCLSPCVCVSLAMCVCLSTHQRIIFPRHTVWCVVTVATENATLPKSSEWRNFESLVSRGTNSK